MYSQEDGVKRQAPTSIRLDSPMMKRLKRISQAEDRAVNWIIKKAIEQYVERWERGKKK